MSDPVPFTRFQFPGGEQHVRLDFTRGIPESVEITHFIRNSDDIMALFLIIDAYRRHGTEFIHLTLPYVPYGRQDRVAVEGESLSLKVFCDMLNAAKCSSVTIWDPHSDVTPALINNCVIIPQEICMVGVPSLSNPVIVCPDSGARKKIYKVAEWFDYNDILFADKVRDMRTGLLSSPTIGEFKQEWAGRDLLIVDDLCDGGGTFIQLAKVLEKLDIGKIHLYVTHGIFSKGLDVFNGLIDEIYCANSWIAPRKSEPGVCGLTIVSV